LHPGAYEAPIGHPLQHPHPLVTQIKALILRSFIFDFFSDSS
jgi:hypothetical protein